MGERLAGTVRACTVAAVSDLTRSLERRMKWIKRRPELPPWWPALQVLGGIVLVGYFAFRLMAGPDDPTAPQSSIPSGTALPVPAGESTTVPDTAPTGSDPTVVTVDTTDAPGGEATITVDTAAGGQVELPASIVERANAAAVAQQPGAQVRRPILATSYRTGEPLPAQLLFNVEIDPSPGSGAPAQYKAVTLVRTSDGWAVS